MLNQQGKKVTTTVVTLSMLLSIVPTPALAYAAEQDRLFIEGVMTGDDADDEDGKEKEAVAPESLDIAGEEGTGLEVETVETSEDASTSNDGTSLSDEGQTDNGPLPGDGETPSQLEAAGDDDGGSNSGTEDGALSSADAGTASQEQEDEQPDPYGAESDNEDSEAELSSIESKPIALDAPVDIALEAGGYVLLEFTAPSDGMYGFESTRSCDTYGELYADSSLNEWLASNDDGGDGANFKLGYTLSAGQTVYLKARMNSSDVSGEMSVAVKDVSHDISYWTLSIDSDACILPGGEFRPAKVALKLGNLEAPEGSYTLFGWETESGEALEGNPSEGGQYYAVYKGADGYSGTIRVNVRVYDYTSVSQDSDISFSLGTVVVDNGSLCSYDFSLSWWLDGEGCTLTEGTDYSLSWLDAQSEPLAGNPTEPGEYTLVVTGIGDYKGKRHEQVTVKSARDISVWTSSVVSDACILPGGEFRSPQLSFTTFDGSQALEGSYVLSGWETDSGDAIEGVPTEGGGYYAVYEGAGDYTGILKVYVYIRDYAEIDRGYIHLSIGTFFVDSGVLYSHDFNLSWWLDGEEHVLTEGVDYTLSWLDDQGGSLAGNPTGPGEYTLVVTGVGCYRGELREQVTLEDGKDISNWNLSVNSDACILPGDGFHAATVSLTALSGDPAPEGSFALVRWETESGDAIEGTPTRGGQYYAVYEGADGYSGTLRAPLHVYDYASIGEDSSVNFSLGSFVIEGGNLRSYDFGLSWWHDGEDYVLAEGKDYTLSWLDAQGVPLAGSPTEPGEYTLVITGVGDYTGERRVPVSVGGFVTMSLGDEVDVEVTGDGCKRGYFEFVAPFDGMFYFVARGSSSASIFLRMADSADFSNSSVLSTSGEFIHPKYMAAGQKVYLAASNFLMGSAQSVSFTLNVSDSLDISHPRVRSQITPYFTDGKSIVTGGVELTAAYTLHFSEGTDFTVSWLDADGNHIDGTPVLPGTYTLVLTGRGACSGERRETVIVSAVNDISAGEFINYVKGGWDKANGYIMPDGSFHYPQICLNGETLSEGMYEFVQWTDLKSGAVADIPTRAGSYDVVVKGSGDYTGTLEGRVTIVDLSDVSNLYLNASEYDLRNGSVVSGNTELFYCIEDVYPHAVRHDLIEGIDYVLSWSDVSSDETLKDGPTKSGQYKLTATGIGNFHGEASTYVTVRARYDLAHAQVKVTDAYYDLDDEYHAPVIDARIAGEKVPSGAYSLDWVSSDGEKVKGAPEPGTYDITLVGKGDYQGSVRVSVKVIGGLYISLNPHFQASVVQQYMLVNGNVTSGAIRLMWNSFVLVEGVDYDVSWSVQDGTAIDGVPSRPGVYNVTIAGKGDYTGETTMRGVQVMDGTDISADAYSWSISGSAYVKDGVFYGPGVKAVHADGTEAREIAYAQSWIDAQKTVEIGEPVKAGLYTLRITGIEGYSGSLDFVVPVTDYYDISDDGMYAASGLGTGYITGDGVFHAPGVAVVRSEWDEFGNSTAKYVPSDSYIVTRWLDSSGGAIDGEPRVAGRYWAEVAGIGRYSGSRLVSVEVVDAAKDISKCTVQNINWGNRTPSLLEALEALTLITPDGTILSSDRWDITLQDAASGEILTLDEIDSLPGARPSTVILGEYFIVANGKNGWTGSLTIYGVHRTSDGINLYWEWLTDKNYEIVDAELTWGFSYCANGRYDEYYKSARPSLLDADYYVGGVAHYIYSGSPIQVRPFLESPESLMAVPNLRLSPETQGAIARGFYLEGVDYTVELSNSVGRSDRVTTGAVLFKRTDASGWSGSVSYVIDPAADLSVLASYASITDGTSTYSAASDPDSRTFVTAGASAVTPAVMFDGNLNLVEGVDYTVTYFDADGNAVAPVAAGDYYAQVTAIQGSRAMNSLMVPFTLAEGASVADGGYIGNRVSLGVGTVDVNDSDTWFADSVIGTLVEGFDYVVDVVSKGLFGDIASNVYVDTYTSEDGGYSTGNAHVVDGRYAGVGGDVYGQYDYAAPVSLGVYSDVYGSTVGIAKDGTAVPGTYGTSAADQNAYEITVKGIGGSGGTLSSVVREQSAQEKFNGQQVYVNGTLWSKDAIQPRKHIPVSGGLSWTEYATRPRLRMSADGTVAVPFVAIPGLTEGVDYEVVGVGEALADWRDASAFSWKFSGLRENGMLLLRGLGAYEGCVRLVCVDFDKSFDDASDIYLDSSRIGVAVENALVDSNGAIVLLKGEKPKVVVSDAATGALLQEGADYTVETHETQDGLEVKVVAAEGSRYSGFATLKGGIKLVEAFDIADAAVELPGAISTGASGGFGIAYAGVEVHPVLTVSSKRVDGSVRLTQGVDYDVVLLDSTGNEVDGITSVGRYTLRLTGLGSWAGTLDVSLQVAGAGNSAVSMRQCVVSVVNPDGNSQAMYALDGGKSEPAVQVRYMGTLLVEGKDYTVEYRNNTKPGNACAVVTAVADSGFEGQAAVGYKVGQTYDLAYGSALCWVDDSGEVHPFTASELPTFDFAADGETYPEVKVALLARSAAKAGRGSTLDEADIVGFLDSSCFTLEWGGNSAAGSKGWVRASGVGVYSGSVSGNYLVGNVFEKQELEIAGQPQDVEAFSGDKATFSVEATGGAGNLSYQWQWRRDSSVNWTNCTAASGEGYDTAVLTTTMNTAKDGRQYRCIVTDTLGARVESAAATLSLKKEATLAIVQQPSSSLVKQGETATFTVSAAGGHGALSYRWQWRANASAKWANCSAASGDGFDTATLGVVAYTARDGRQFRCAVSDAAGRMVYSNVATLALAADALTISSQPADAVRAIGADATFKVRATGGAGSLKYQWQWRKDANASWTNCTSASGEGWNTSTLTTSMNAAKNGRQYRCVVSDAVGTQVVSGVATLTLTAAKPLSIKLNPVDASASLGGEATFTVKADGGSSTLSYRWQWRRDTSASWANCTAASGTGWDTSTLTTTMNAAKDGRQYRCVVSDGATSVASEPATLSLKTAGKPLTVVSDPEDVHAKKNADVTFSVSATGGQGTLTCRWQWRQSESASWVNCTSASGEGWDAETLTVKAYLARDGRQFRCAVSDASGAVVYSEAGTLHVEG